MRRAAVAAGAALVVAAMAATQTWLDRHFLPSFFIPRHWYVLIETAARLTIGAAGMWLVLARSWIARRVCRDPAAVARVLVAATVAILASEYALRWMHARPTEWLIAGEEPKRQPDARLGWALTPSRIGRAHVGGRTIAYAIDAAGYRVRRIDEPVDPGRPTIVFAGESVMFGEGLSWEESIPAQTAARLEIQSANIAVHGYSTDQMYLRLQRELPRFRRAVAVIAIFMTELFGRNLDDDRPHLAPGLAWQPAVPPSSLLSLAGLLVPYRRTETIERGISVTHEALRAIVALARARGATPLVVVPQFGEEDPAQRTLRLRLLPDDVPIVLVRLDPDWRLPWDRHPNARAAGVIAGTLAARLRQQ